MISNPFFLLSILIGSLLAFFTTAFAVEILIKIFQVQQHRVRSMLRLIPLVSLFVDLLFGQSSITQWINPLKCVSCVQKFFLEIFFPSLKAQLDEKQMSLVNYLDTNQQHPLFPAFFIAFVLITLGYDPS